MIKVAHVCKLISDNTRKQAELAQNCRNLIHPGRQARLSGETYAIANLSFMAAEAKGGTDGMSDKTSFVVVHSIMSRMD